MSIDFICDTTTNSLKYWKTIDDITMGSTGVKGKEIYLPKTPKESDLSYNYRATKADFLDSFNPTVDGISGLVFKKPIVYSEDIPTQLKATIENANMQGDHLDILIKDLFDTAMRKGISFALTDMPKGTAENKADEISQGIRPYYTIIQPENVTSWKTTTINGQIVLSQVKIREFTEIDDDTNIYATSTETRYRVLEIGTYKVYTEKGDFIEEGETGLNVIPFVALNINAKGFFASFPPLYDLALINISHYNLVSDSRYSAHTACIPFYFGKGFHKEDVDNAEIAPNTFLTNPNEQADVKIVDYDGKGVAVTGTLIDRYETKMREFGLSIISQDKELTATEVTIASGQSQSKLNGWVRMLVDTVEIMLIHASMFYGLSGGGSIEIEADILSKPLVPEDVKVLNDMVLSGNMSIETMYSIIASGSFRMPKDFDIEVEKEKLSQGGLLLSSNKTD